MKEFCELVSLLWPRSLPLFVAPKAIIFTSAPSQYFQTSGTSQRFGGSEADVLVYLDPHEAWRFLPSQQFSGLALGIVFMSTAHICGITMDEASPTQVSGVR